MSSSKDAIETILSRNNFYRDGYRKLQRICLIMGLVVAVLVGALVTLVLSSSVRHVFFATTSDGRIINIVPLNDPSIVPDGKLVTWSIETARRVMQFGFHDYRDRLQDAAPNFTKAGWESFTKALKEARILEAVEARKLVVTADIAAAPEIISRGERNGVYIWIVQMPITIKFQGDQAPTAISGTLRLTITRVSTLQNAAGIGIEQWIVK